MGSGAFAKDAIGISLIKGIEFKDGKPILISDLLQDEMAKSEGSPKVDMSVLMGANVANEVAKGDFAEATIGCTNLANGKKWCKLFNTSDFKVDPVEDVAGAELCGALKNVVALGAGFCDGLGFGGNTKAAIIRIGLKEMQKFCETFYGMRGIKNETFIESSASPTSSPLALAAATASVPRCTRRTSRPAPRRSGRSSRRMSSTGRSFRARARART